jgi:hypothetical protein
MTYLYLLGVLLLNAGCVFLWKLGYKRSGVRGIAAGVGIVFFGLVAAVLTLSFFFVHAACGEYLFPAVEAPDHTAIAEVGEFDCGALGGFHSYVRIRSTKSISGRWRWNGGSKVFATEDDPRLISLTWTDRHELTIRHPIQDRFHYFKCDSAWADVKIRCESYQPPEPASLSSLPEPNRWLW